MALWTDGQKVFDDMGGEALTHQGWPAGLTQITQVQADAIISPPLTLAQAQAAQIAIINAGCNASLAALVAPYPPLEVATFANQYGEAQAYTVNAAAVTPTLSAIATVTGQTVAQVAASVLAKAASYTVASGAAIGKRQALTAQIQAATSVAAVQAIVW
jgi:hypothetical protein